MKRETIKRYIRKYWTVIWLVAALLSCFGIYAFAKYGDAHNVAKKVVRTGKNYTNVFSSNYLTGSAPTHPKTQIEGFDGDSFFDIEIWNYDRKHPTNVCHEDIPYTLTAKLVRPNGDSYTDYTSSTISNELDNGDVIKLYRVTTNGSTSVSTLVGKLGYSTTDNEVVVMKTIDTDTTVDPSKSLKILAENGATSHSYKLEFPSGLIDKNVYVYLKAEPAVSDLSLETLSGYFYVKTQTVNLSSGWNGEIGESTTSTDEDLLPKKYEAYNFIITGSGTETMRLCWDANLFTPNAKEMNDLFAVSDLSALTTDTNGLTYVDVTLNAAESGGRYDLQFYVKDETARTAINAMTTWTQMNEKFKLIPVPTT